jgi:hypothetical protein
MEKNFELLKVDQKARTLSLGDEGITLMQIAQWLVHHCISIY